MRKGLFRRAQLIACGAGTAMLMTIVAQAAPELAQNPGADAQPQQTTPGNRPAEPAGDRQATTPAQPRDTQTQRAAAPGEVTLIGCVEFETDYRKRKDAGRGGVLGSGVGQSNEFVLTMAQRAPAAAASEGRAGGQSGSAQAAAGSAADRSGAAPVGTSGSTADYMLTGNAESELKRAVGKQVEVVGTLENADSSRAGAADVSELPRINITAWHPVADFCPAEGTQKPQAAPAQPSAPAQPQTPPQQK